MSEATRLPLTLSSSRRIGNPATGRSPTTNRPAPGAALFALGRASSARIAVGSLAVVGGGGGATIGGATAGVEPDPASRTRIGARVFGLFGSGSGFRLRVRIRLGVRAPASGSGRRIDVGSLSPLRSASEVIRNSTSSSAVLGSPGHSEVAARPCSPPPPGGDRRRKGACLRGHDGLDGSRRAVLARRRSRPSGATAAPPLPGIGEFLRLDSHERQVAFLVGVDSSAGAVPKLVSAELRSSSDPPAAAHWPEPGADAYDRALSGRVEQDVVGSRGFRSRRSGR